MSIGERIRHFRNTRGLTQQQLGVVVGFSEKTAGVRIAQYESGARTPKIDLLEAIAKVLEVSESALSTPDIKTVDDLMHVLFVLEENFGFKIDEIDGKLCLCVGITKNQCGELYNSLREWKRVINELEEGNISLKDYELWRCNYSHQETVGKE